MTAKNNNRNFSTRQCYYYLIVCIVLSSKWHTIVVNSLLQSPLSSSFNNNHRRHSNNNNDDINEIAEYVTTTKNNCKSSLKKNYPGRRNVLTKIVSTAVLSSLVLLPTIAPANAIITDDEKKLFKTIQTDQFSMMVPSSWTIITSSPTTKKNDENGILLFSSIDLQGGATLTVVQERGCLPQQYFDQPELCDFVASEKFTEKDAEKLLVRRDEREQTAKVLGAPPSILESIISDEDMIELVARTEIPTGAPPKKDVIGRITESTIIRLAKARVANTTNNGLISVWLSAPLDEWQKLVAGTRLQQVLQSIQINK